MTLPSRKSTIGPACPECGSSRLDFGPGADTDIVRCAECRTALGTVVEWQSAVRVGGVTSRLGKILHALRAH